MDSVRVGCRYRLYPNPIRAALLGYCIPSGSIVKVVNLPGGSRGGLFRNVEDVFAGNLDFVHVGDLSSLTRSTR